jgi:polyphosphate glucokinase
MAHLDSSERILSVDIGGSRVKGAILDRDGKMLTDYTKIDTPSSGAPEDILNTILSLASRLATYTKVSVGFPGYVRRGIVHTAPNLSTEKWRGFALRDRLTELLKKPVRVVNDADLQGLGVAKGNGLEMVVTLGTGFGTAILLDGNLLPHLEFAHHPIEKEGDYDDYIGERALDAIGLEAWNKRVERVIGILKTVFNYDRLYIGGGNSKRITFKLADNITLVANVDGIKGGVRLWEQENDHAL